MRLTSLLLIRFIIIKYLLVTLCLSDLLTVANLYPVRRTASVAKTDGRYLYVLEDSGKEIAVVDTKDQGMKKAASVSSPRLVLH